MDPSNGKTSRPVTRRTVTRTVTWTRPHRVVRTPTESAAVWRPRRRAYAIGLVSWSLLLLVSAVTGSSVVPLWLLGAAAVLSAAVVVKASVLVRGAERSTALDRAYRHGTMTTRRRRR